LLDIYTLQRSFEKLGGIDGKQIAFVGDLARGRTVRSLASLLRHFDGVKAYFVAPDDLQIGPDILAALDRAGMAYEVTSDFRSVIPLVDAIYMTRLQDEWDAEKGASGKDISAYQFHVSDLELLQPHTVLMHPLPRRQEVDPAVDQDPRAMYWRQVRNGMWIRVALILSTFDRDTEVDRYYHDLVQ
jgi:aspartate carbamoyltransferase catalytic subunit